MRMRLAAILAVALMAGTVSGTAAAAPELAWHLIQQYPHSTSAFTEGLAICRGDLVESAGLYGDSYIEVRTLHTGRVLARHYLPPRDFGEGTTCADGRIVQLTWREGVAFSYDHGLNLLKRRPYAHQGWGLAFNGKRLVASDGSATLYWLNSRTLETVGKLKVTDNGKPVQQLNELEWAHGAIWANVWHSSHVARIDPASGHVTGWLDLAALVKLAHRDPHWHDSAENVLNGIAYDANNKHFFITGKRWPLMFEIALGAGEHDEAR